MSNAYTSDGKRRSSMTHATRSWTCDCGRTVRGNGGKSSHQRACRVWAEAEIARLDYIIEKMLVRPVTTWIGHIEDYETKQAALRARLATSPGSADSGT